MVVPGCASPCCPRTARRSRSSPTPRTPTTRTSCSSSSTSTRRSCAAPACARPASLGHQDPEWRPDGEFLLYIQNGRDGSRGAPVIMRYNAREREGPGPDGGRLHAAVLLPERPVRRRDPDHRIRDRRRHPRCAGTASELLRVTDDGASWAPDLVAGRRRDRVPAHRRPDRRPAAGEARGRRARAGPSRRRST